MTVGRSNKHKLEKKDLNIKNELQRIWNAYSWDCFCHILTFSSGCLFFLVHLNMSIYGVLLRAEAEAVKFSFHISESAQKEEVDTQWTILRPNKDIQTRPFSDESGRCDGINYLSLFVMLIKFKPVCSYIYRGLLILTVVFLSGFTVDLCEGGWFGCFIVLWSMTVNVWLLFESKV